MRLANDQLGKHPCESVESALSVVYEFEGTPLLVPHRPRTTVIRRIGADIGPAVRVLPAALATLCLIFGAPNTSAIATKSKEGLLDRRVAPVAPKKSFADNSNSHPSSPIFTEVADQT